MGACPPKGRHRRLRLRGTSKCVNRELRWGVQLPQKTQICMTYIKHIISMIQIYKFKYSYL